MERFNFNPLPCPNCGADLFWSAGRCVCVNEVCHWEEDRWTKIVHLPALYKPDIEIVAAARSVVFTSSRANRLFRRVRRITYSGDPHGHFG